MSAAGGVGAPCNRKAPGSPRGGLVSRSEKRILRFAQDDVSLFSDTSVREWIRTNLDLVDLRPVLRAALVVEHGARARHRPQTFAFPAGARVVDASVHELGVEAQRIRHAQVDHLAV